MDSTNWTTLYSSISSHYEGYYGKSSNNMYNLTPEKAEDFLEDCDDLYTDIQMKMLTFCQYKNEGEYFRELHNSLDDCVVYIREYLEKYEKNIAFSEVSGLPIELNMLISEYL